MVAAVITRSTSEILTKDGWIIPDELLQWIRQGVTERVTSTAIKIIQQSSGLIETNAKLIAEYYVDGDILAQKMEKMTNWHKALNDLSILPKTIPRLPSNIFEILGSPWLSDKTVEDACSLYLVPCLTIHELIKLSEDYGKKKCSDKYKEFQCMVFWDRASMNYGNIRFDKPEWLLMSNHLLDGSYDLPYKERVEMVQKLGRDYEVPSLIAAVAFVVLNKVATRKAVFQPENENRRKNFYSTCVQEVIGDKNLAVWSSSSLGMMIGCDAIYQYHGVAVVRKF